MSKVKHRFYRSVLQVSRQTVVLNKLTLELTKVLWCVKSKETSRTFQSDHMGVTIYINGTKFQGIAARRITESDDFERALKAEFSQLNIERE